MRASNPMFSVTPLLQRALSSLGSGTSSPLHRPDGMKSSRSTSSSVFDSSAKSEPLTCKSERGSSSFLNALARLASDYTYPSDKRPHWLIEPATLMLELHGQPATGLAMLLNKELPQIAHAYMLLGQLAEVLDGRPQELKYLLGEHARLLVPATSLLLLLDGLVTAPGSFSPLLKLVLALLRLCQMIQVLALHVKDFITTYIDHVPRYRIPFE